MTEELFKIACSNYIKTYKDFAHQEFIKKPDNLENDEYTFKYFIKGKTVGASKSAKFTYLQRKYFLKNNKVAFKESEKTFSIKLNEKTLDELNSSEKEFISENYLAIIAYISSFEITPDSSLIELENYITSNDKVTAKKSKKEKDQRIGKQIKTTKTIFYKDGLVTKKSIGTIKSIKGEKITVSFKEFLTAKTTDVDVSESDFEYIEGDK